MMALDTHTRPADMEKAEYPFTNSNDYITGRKPVSVPGESGQYAQRFTPR